MSARRALFALVLAAVVAVGIVVLLRNAGDAGLAAPAFAGGTAPLAAEAKVSPRVVLFGDTITAAVDVTFSRRRVVPDSVRVTPHFLPWSLIAPPMRVRRDSAETTYIRTTYTLRCVISPCVPNRNTASLEFDPVRVTYRRTGEPKAESIVARWPVLVVHSQIVADDFKRREAVASPWRADAVSLPAVSYRVSPGLVRGVALAVGALLALAGSALGVLAIPARAPRPEPEPEPLLPPLEHALVLLEADVRLNGAADQRRALELVAEEMEERGDLRLASRARGMAWSEDVPAVDETRGFAAQVRAVLVEDEPDDEEVDDAPLA